MDLFGCVGPSNEVLNNLGSQATPTELEVTVSKEQILKESQRRRTFAIISHPDAGKTTLTEKLLLYGGAIHLAGAVKAKKNQKHTTSDWMDIEKERGISISASVLQFEYAGIHVNLLDTPGHKDFSEDTYRTLMAADAAVMLIDAGKGVEPQTIKLFEVCRMRGIPIFTFMNKLDRPSKDPLDLLDELEKILGIRSCPITWPIGMGDRFKGVYNRRNREVLLFESQDEANVKRKLGSQTLSGIHDPILKEIAEADDVYEQLLSEIELLEAAGDSYDEARVLQGQLTPVFFGSAMNNFGVENFLQHFIKMAPAPGSRKTLQEETLEPSDLAFSSFIFKIQANMDPRHRDRVAFMRVCSGHFERGMSAYHSRTSEEVKLARPMNFFAQDRVIIEEAWPGDIVGLVDTSGELRIGDTLTTRKGIEFGGIPRFSPEHFSSIRIGDPMKRKQLRKGLEQLSEEGVVQVFSDRDLGDRDSILGAVGGLQFEVLKERLKIEYGVAAIMEPLPYVLARWIRSDKMDLKLFEGRSDSRCVLDRDQNPVILFKSPWALRWAEDHYKDCQFLPIA